MKRPEQVGTRKYYVRKEPIDYDFFSYGSFYFAIFLIFAGINIFFTLAFYEPIIMANVLSWIGYIVLVVATTFFETFIIATILRNQERESYVEIEQFR